MNRGYDVGDLVIELKDSDAMNCMGFSSRCITFFQFVQANEPALLSKFEERHPLKMAVIQDLIFVFIQDENKTVSTYPFSPIINRYFNQVYMLPVDRCLDYALYLVDEDSRRVCAYHKGLLSQYFSQAFVAACLDIGMRDKSVDAVCSQLNMLLELYSCDDLYHIASDYGSI